MAYKKTWEQQTFLHHSDTLRAPQLVSHTGSISAVLRQHLAFGALEYSIIRADSSPFFSNAPLMKLSFNANLENNRVEAEMGKSGFLAALSERQQGLWQQSKPKTRWAKKPKKNNLMFVWPDRMNMWRRTRITAQNKTTKEWMYHTGVQMYQHKQ